MRLKHTLICLCSVFLFSTPVMAVTLEYGSVPIGKYVVVSSTEIESSGGTKVKIKDLLEKKKKSVAEEVYQALSKKDGKGPVISGDLEGTTNGGFYWTGTLDKRSSTASSFVARDGVKANSVSYDIYIPVGKIKKGDDYEYVNQSVLSKTEDFLSQFKSAVAEGVLAGSVKAGYNIYEPYSEDQLYIKSIMEEKEGVNVFTNTADVKYTLAYFYSPLFGKIPSGETPMNTKEWKDKGYLERVLSEKLKKNHTEKTVEVDIDAGYFDFIQGNAPECESIIETDKAKMISAKGVEAYEMAGAKYEPSGAVNYLLHVAVPIKINRLSPSVYGLSESDFVLVDDIKLSIAKNFVYIKDGISATPTDNENSNQPSQESSDFVKDSSFMDYNIDRGKLALYGLKQANGTIVGVLVPLKYMEAIYDTGSNADLYATGRMLEFVENYTSNLKFASPSTGMFNIIIPNGGTQGGTIKYYAFKEDSTDFTNKGDHTDIGETPSSCRIHVTFSSNKEKGRGFMLVRNNLFLQDNTLINWLQSSEADKLSYVKAEHLLNRITGKFELGDNIITFEDWMRMQEIKNELANRNQGSIVSFINVITIIFGVVLAIYGWLLPLAYWLDVFNNFFDEFSFLQMMTRGKMYPVTNKEEKEYLLRSSSSGVKYVYIHDVFIMTLVCCIISLLFIFGQPIIHFLVNVWLFVQHILGGY